MFDIVRPISQKKKKKLCLIVYNFYSITSKLRRERNITSLYYKQQFLKLFNLERSDQGQHNQIVSHFHFFFLTASVHQTDVLAAVDQATLVPIMEGEDPHQHDYFQF